VDVVVLWPAWQKKDYVAEVLSPRELPPEPGWEQTPFRPPEPDNAYAALRDFYAERPHAAWLNPLTGLPAYLYGDLQEPPEGRNVQAVITFLKEHELMLAGLPRGVNLSRVSESNWHEDGAYQVTFLQINKSEVPLYGCGVTCNLLPDRLEFVTSTLHPARANAIDELVWPLTWKDWKHKMAPIAAPDDREYLIRPQEFAPPPRLREESQEHGWPADRWILPYLQHEATEGMYRPVWRTIIVDQENESWLALIDALDLQVLHIEPTKIEASVTADLYASAPEAFNGKLTPKNLNYGWRKNKMKEANRVHFVDPPAGEGNSQFVEPDDLNADPNLRYLSATVFYHLRQVQQKFPGLGLFTWLTNNAGTFKPHQDIGVSLSDASGSACYKTDCEQIILYAGTANALPATSTPVLEPGFDCEVIYHEFTHAMNRYYNPLLFQTQDISYVRELDEGLAFYFACALSGNARWAEYAYQKWIDSNDVSFRDLVEGPKTPQDAENAAFTDPSGSTDQTVGLWWGRVFWAIAQQKGDNWCNQLLIKALKSLSGPLAAREVFAKALVACAGESAEEIEIILSNLKVFDS